MTFTDTHDLATQLNCVFMEAPGASGGDGVGSHSVPAADLRRMFESPALNGQCLLHAKCAHGRFSLQSTV